MNKPILELVVSKNLPVDELLNAAEFILHTIQLCCLGGMDFEDPFKNTDHPHIDSISEYAINKFKGDRPLYSENEIKEKAEDIMKELKSYCKVRLLNKKEQSLKLLVETN